MKFAITFSYLGKNYHGYQIQKNAPSVQGEIEKALQEVTNQPIKIFASGRTDKGVSALMQVAHFESEKAFVNLKERLNLKLPSDIRIIKVEKVNDDFHARFNCVSKTYEYSFYHSACNIPYLDEYALYCKQPYDIEKMKAGALHFLGEHDFTSFCASGGGAVDKTRKIISVEFVVNHLGVHTFRIKGNGFLYNMVRIIMGTLLDVGYGKLEPSDILKILNAKTRAHSSITVSAHGLLLVDVEY